MNETNNKVVLNIETNVKQVDKDIEQMNKATSIYEEALKRVKNISSSSLEVFKQMRLKLQEQKQAVDDAMNSYRKLIENNPKNTKSGSEKYNEQIKDVNSKLFDMAINKQQNSPEYNALINLRKEYESEVNNANAIIESSMGGAWTEISQSISGKLAKALTTPIDEGENALLRFKDIAYSVMQELAQSYLTGFFTQKLTEKSIGSRFKGAMEGAAAGSAGGWWGAAAGAIGGFFKNANGNVFYNGNVIPFANGGVVNQNTYFPMSNGRTGLMGERGAEAIMPLKRTSNGQLGVTAEAVPANINIYNQASTEVETVRRPDGDTDIFIRKVNNALRNERTQSGFSKALQRQQPRGVQAS